jgi:nitrite reductase/ring-hydroxylating ferredoxin subunit
MHENDANECTACGGCDTGRREFLSTAVRVALLLAVPLSWRTGVALASGKLQYPLPASDGATIDKQNEVIVARVQGKGYAFALSCPHQRTMLRWLPEEGRFQCPKHKSKYRPDGSFISGRATRGMDRHPITLEGNMLVVDPSITYREDNDPAAWQAAFAAVS